MSGLKHATKVFDWVVFGENIHWNQGNGKSMKFWKRSSTIDWLLCLRNPQWWTRLTSGQCDHGLFGGRFRHLMPEDCCAGINVLWWTLGEAGHEKLLWVQAWEKEERNSFWLEDYWAHVWSVPRNQWDKKHSCWSHELIETCKQPIRDLQPLHYKCFILK